MHCEKERDAADAIRLLTAKFFDYVNYCYYQLNNEKEEDDNLEFPEANDALDYIDVARMESYRLARSNLHLGEWCMRYGVAAFQTLIVRFYDGDERDFSLKSVQWTHSCLSLMMMTTTIMMMMITCVRTDV